MALSEFWHDMNTNFRVFYTVVLGKDEKPLFVRCINCNLYNLSKRVWTGARIGYIDMGLDSRDVRRNYPYGVGEINLPILTWDNKVVKEGRAIVQSCAKSNLVVEESGALTEWASNGVLLSTDKKWLRATDERLPLMSRGQSEDIDKQLVSTSMFDFIELSKDLNGTLDGTVNARDVIVPDDIYHISLTCGSKVETLVMPEEMSFCRVVANDVGLKNISLPKKVYGAVVLGMIRTAIERLDVTVAQQYPCTVWVTDCANITRINVGVTDAECIPTQFEHSLVVDGCPNLEYAEFPINPVGYNYVSIRNCPKLKYVNLISDGGMPDARSLTTISEGSPCDIVISMREHK